MGKKKRSKRIDALTKRIAKADDDSGFDRNAIQRPTRQRSQVSTPDSPLLPNAPWYHSGDDVVIATAQTKEC